MRSGRLLSLRDDSIDAVTRHGAPEMSDDLNWRDHVAGVAAAKVGRAGDKEAISQARRLVDVCARLGLGIPVTLGLLSGWVTTAVLLRPPGGQVHVEWTLMMIFVVPLTCLIVRGVAMLLLQDSLLLDFLLDIWQRLARWRPSMSLRRGRAPKKLIKATADAICSMLSDTDCARPLSAAGSGVFWTAYAVASLVTILIVTNVAALGFGFGWAWESSWFWLDLRREVVVFTRKAVELAAQVLRCIWSDGLTPVAPAPIAPDDPETLAVRRSWVCALAAGVGVYVLLPMAIWTVCSFVSANRKMNHWPPIDVPATPSATPARRRRKVPTEAPLRPPPAGGGPCTHLVRLEWPGEAVTLPAPLDRIVDLGNVDTIADLERVRGILRAAPARVAIIGWLPKSPERGIRRKLLTLAGASTHAPLLVLDGGHALRRAEPPRTVATRLDDWRNAASETGVAPFECDLAGLTEASRRDLTRAVGRGADHDVGREPPTASGSGPARR